MSALDVLYHLVNFILPAVFVGSALAFWGKRYTKLKMRRAWFINSLVGIAALATGLVVFGVDGKMASYALLIVTCSLAQLFFCWRK